MSPHCHLMLHFPSAVPPAATARMPALEKLLAVGRRVEQSGGIDDWLGARFGMPRPVPQAALSLLGEGHAPGAYCWFRADPVHFQLLRDSFALADPDLAAPDAEEAQALLAALNRHFGADGMLLVAPHPRRWYLRLEHTPQIATHALAQAVGRDVEPLLPYGPEAARWRSWLNEVQMLLHRHPVNQGREARGALPVNSLWLYGGGVLAGGGMASVQHVWAGQALARGLALACAVPLHEVPVSASAWLAEAASGTHLLVLDGLGLADLESGWCVPLLRGLRQGALASFTLHVGLPDRVVSCHVRRRDLWRLWRRRRSWGEWLGEHSRT